MLTACTLPLSFEQREFLDEIRVRTNNLKNYRETANSIMLANGHRNIYRSVKGNPTLYLRRFYIFRSPDREAMIHQFFMGDRGPLHDHPATSWGQILETGYYERLCKELADGITLGEYDADRKHGDWSMRPGSNFEHDDPDSFHKVKLRNVNDAGNIFTFFVMEKRNPFSWGFRGNNGHFIHFSDMNKHEHIEEVQSSHEQYPYGWYV